MRIRLDTADPTPLSAQLVAAIGKEIARGRLMPGDRLPPVRELAESLDLAPNTVAKAYRDLQGEGLLVGRGRSGTFVSDRLPERPDDVDERLSAAATAFARRARQLRVEPVEAIRAVRRALASAD